MSSSLIESSAAALSKIAYLNFVNGLKSEETKVTFSKHLFKYLDHLGLTEDNLADLLKKDVKDIQNDIISYILKLKEEGYSFASMNLRLSAINSFFLMNDVIINRNRIGRYLGEHIKTVKDRPYTTAEIKKMVDASDIKFKVFVTLMASTGCRVGAIPSLKIHNLKYIENHKLYHITFYENTKSEYYSFTTLECAAYIDEYLEYRKRCGEKITDNSPLIRDDFIIDDLLHIENPKHITVSTLNYYLRNILIKIGIRKVIPLTESKSKKKERKNVAQNHGFRKFTHTTMANKLINPEIREMLLGHSIGLSDAYYRPTEQQCLNEFLKVVDDLTINNEYRLSMQVKELEEKKDYQQFVIDKKLKDKDLEIEKMQQQLEKLTSETSRNRQEFIDIAKKIREIKEADKVDPLIKEKLEAGIINKEELLNSWCEIEDRREQQRDEIEEWIEQKSSSTIQQEQQEDTDFFEKNIRPTLKRYSTND